MAFSFLRQNLREPREWKTELKCYPMTEHKQGAATIGELNYNYSGKVFLPTSVYGKVGMCRYGLKNLVELDVYEKMHELDPSPVSFKLTNHETGLSTYTGVWSCDGAEGHVYVPLWLMETLGLKRLDFVEVSFTMPQPPRASFIKVQAQHTSFIDIHDHKAVMEHFLVKSYNVLSVNDVFSFFYNNDVHRLKVMGLKTLQSKHHPGEQVEIQTASMHDIEQLEVDFDEPVGYKEYEAEEKLKREQEKVDSARPMARAINYDALVNMTGDGKPKARNNFAGQGQKLKARKGKAPSSTAAVGAEAESTTTPHQDFLRSKSSPMPLRLPANELFLGYNVVPLEDSEEASPP